MLGAIAGAGAAGPFAAGAGALAFAEAMSASTMRPCGPLPVIAARSMPRSFASRLASGEAKTRVAVPLAAPDITGA